MSEPEVRDEWVEAVFDSNARHPKPAWSRDAIRAALAAVVPLIEADVGERIAAAIRDIAAKPILHGDHEWKRGAVDGLERAAVVAENGGDRIARAVATGDCTCGPGDACSDPNCGGTPR